MQTIAIKSVAKNRVRLKSDIFRIPSNIQMIEKTFESDFYYFRSNIAAKSIVFKLNATASLEQVLSRLHELFATVAPATSAKTTPLSGQACQSLESCKSCDIEPIEPKAWRRKLIEFGLLTGFAIYIFVKENILGMTIAASPFSLVAAVAVVAAVPLLQSSWEDIKSNKFTLETFMSGTLVLAIFFGEATAAFEIIYILRGGALLEEYIATKSRREIHKLIELESQKAFILIDGVELEVDVESLNEGDIVVCRSGDQIPVDGVVIDGRAEINEALINGRSESACKIKGDTIYAGTICESGRISIKVGATGSATYISRVMRDVENSLACKSPAELEADKLASRLLKLGSVLTVGTYLITGSFLNAFSVMIVMSCPCATILAASTAISAGIANGAKQGILIKGGEALEQVSQSEVFCFDKTGTLTTGKPIVTNFYLHEGVTKEKFLAYIAMAEYRNEHPIAVALVEYAKEQNIPIGQRAKSRVLLGLGVEATYKEKSILVGNRQLMLERGIAIDAFAKDADAHLKMGDTVIYLAVEGQLMGCVSLQHEVRPGAKEMIEELRNKGVKHIVLLTGDEEKVANAFALDFGFDGVYANQTPYDKAHAIEELKEKYHNVVMVGDGVNDTLAMSKADVAVSFAAGGSKAAIEVSDIAITHSHPEDVVELYNLSKKSLKVVNQNYWIGTSTNLIGVAFASVGLLSPVAAGAIHIGHTVGIMANSSRLALTKTTDKERENR